jgi:hypothetical protein
MINLQFPKLNNALIKNQKDLDENDPRRGVIVIDKHAIILNAKFCMVVDLYSYFSIDGGITDRAELDELKDILFYMNGKVFNSEYWNELVKGANMEMHEGKLFIETPKYAKDLHYKDAEINLYEPLQRLLALSEGSKGMVPAISIPFEALELIYATLKPQFKADHLILEFQSTDKPVRFTTKDRKFVFGFIMPHYESLEEGFRFEYLDNFAKNDQVEYFLEEYKPSAVPQAPTIPNREEEILASRPESLFDHNGE